jgi:hypothetical protein
MVTSNTTFNFIHSYFSSPTTCPTSIHYFFSPFIWDSIFGSLDTSFQYKWHGIGYAHPDTKQDMQQAIHWARLAAQLNPTALTILITPDQTWYTNIQQLHNPFPDTHILVYFEANTLTYKKPNIPPELQKPGTEPNAIYIYIYITFTTNILMSALPNNYKNSLPFSTSLI